MTRIQPLGTSSKPNSEQKLQEKAPGKNSDQNASPAETPRKTIQSRSRVLSFFTSIKFILVFIIFLLILSCTVVFDSIWITAFSSEVGTLSEKVRKSEFDVIISYTETSIKNVVLATESTKSQLDSNFDFTNQTLIMDRTFRLQKVIKSHIDFLNMLSIGDASGNMYGITVEETSVMYTAVNQGQNQSYWNCIDPEHNDVCIHQTKPDKVVNSTDYTLLSQTATRNPGKTIFSPSFVASTNSNQLNIACTSSISSYGKINDFVTIVMNLEVLSEFLYKQTVNITGTVVFVFETQSKNMIASGFLEDVFTERDSTRKTFSTHGGGVTKFGDQIALQFNNDFQNLACNTNVTVIIDDTYVSVRRMCIDEGIDWILVYSVPKWNYIGNMIFAIVCAIVGSVVVVIFGLTMTTVFSIMVVKPFQNLIDSFELVSNMELDNFRLSRSLLSEVKSLQVHFIGMVERIRLYRKFIPGHLLSKLDNNNSEDGEVEKVEETPLQEKHKDSSSFSNSNTNSHSGILSRKLLKQQSSVVNMFSLYLEKKRVTAVSAFLDGVNILFNNANPKECLSILTDVFDVINYVAKISNGQVGKFENETVTILFNASGDQHKHEMKGLQCCHTLLKKLITLQENKLSQHIVYENNPTLNLDFRIVATAQECMW